MADAQNAVTLCLVDDELLAYATAILTSTSHYALTTLERGLYGSAPAAHTSGASFARLDNAIFKYDLPNSYIGKPFYVKFQSVNVFGQAVQSLAACTAYSYTPIGSSYLGPVASALALGTSLDYNLASLAVTENDDFGLVSDPLTNVIDLGLASDVPSSLAIGSGGTGATTATAALTNIGGAASGANSDITSLSGLSTALSVAQGGTGAMAAAGARSNLGAAAAGANSDITKLSALAGDGAVSIASASGSATARFSSGGDVLAVAGLISGARYRVNVSPDGSTFHQAIDIDPGTGHVGLGGATADANNGVSALGTSFLFTAAVDSCRFTFNKAATGNDASLTFETGFSARALAGLLGSDGYQLKVSPDGATFFQVYVADQTTGNLAFKALIGTQSYTVGSLPTGFNGALAFASNGRKIGEGSGAGTGVPVCFSNGSWRRFSDDSVVAA